jgi:riboflavin kinase / FMN adenylyltransferase
MSNEFNVKKACVVVTGNFDGCHLGHQSLFEQLKQYGKSNDLKPLVLSFDKHTRSVTKGLDIKLLSPLFEKKKWFEEEELSFDYLNFEAEIMALTAKDFVFEILINRFGAKAWIVGFDHRFGKDLQLLDASFIEWASLKGLEIIEGKELELKTSKVNSTLVRHFLEMGDVEKVNELLGRPYSVLGEVVQGDQIGRTIDFPTANLEIETDKKLPATGVYGGVVKIKNRVYRAMTHLGARPTLDTSDIRLEVYVLDFSEDLYGKSLCFEFMSKIRGITKFANLYELKVQLKKDEAYWRKTEF